MELWQRGFGVVKSLVEGYAGGQDRRQQDTLPHSSIVYELLADIINLIMGFIEHFSGALDLIMG